MLTAVTCESVDPNTKRCNIFDTANCAASDVDSSVPSSDTTAPTVIRVKKTTTDLSCLFEDTFKPYDPFDESA